MSIGAAVLTFREGLEAALIIAIILGYLRKVGRTGLRWPVWAGAISAALLAVAFTIVLQAVGAQFVDPAKGIFEGLTSLFAVSMLTYMIFWMARQARYIKGSLEHSVKQSLADGARWGLFALAFMTVAREGLETALFLSASVFQSSALATVFGGIVGLLVSFALAWAVYVAGVRIQLRQFFKYTSILLVIFGASILRYGVSEFEDVGLLPPIVEQVWNAEAWLPSESGIGAVFQALTGYTANPSLLQLIVYFGYLLVVGILLLRSTPRVMQPAPSANAVSANEAPKEHVKQAESVGANTH